MIGRGDEALVFAPHFRARAHDPAREGEDDAGDGAHRRRRPLRSPAGGGRIGAHDEQIAASHRLLGKPGFGLADELALHHGDAPESFSTETFGDLEAIAEIAERIAEPEPLCPRLICKPGKTGGRRGGEHALADPVLQLFLQFRGARSEQQHPHPGPSVRCCLGGKALIDPRLHPAGDDRGGEAGEALRGNLRPFRRIGGDDEGGRPHGEGLGEARIDADPVGAEAARRLPGGPGFRYGFVCIHGHRTTSRAPSPIAASGTSKAPSGAP